MSDLRVDLVEDLVDSCKAEHSDAASSFTALDTKAQNTITVAGIFLAATLAFFRGNELQQLMTIGSHVALIVLGIVVLTLMVSILFCIWAMRIRDVPIDDTTFSVKEVQQVLKEPVESLPELFESHFFDQARNWNERSAALRVANDRKAQAIRWGQLFLGGAILFVAFLILYTLHAVWNLPTPMKPS